MDRHANYAAAIAIRQQVLGDVIRIMYHAGIVEHWLNGPFASNWAALFLDVPLIEMRSADDDRVRISITGWGLLWITPPGGVEEARDVLLTAQIIVAPQLSIDTTTSQLVIGLDGRGARLGELTIEPYAGGPFSPAASTYIASPDFRAEVQRLLGTRISTLSIAGSGVSLAFLGAIASDPTTTVSARVLDGVLAIGIDVARSDVTTVGDRSLLVDFTDGNHVATWINPIAVPLAYSAVRASIAAQVAALGATLDSFSFVVEEGWFRISGSASQTGGSVDFSMKAVPRLVRPGVHTEWDEEYGEHFEYTTPAREELWFDMQDVEVDVDPDWWVVLLEVFGSIITLGIGAFAADAIMGMIRGNVEAGIEAQSDTSAGARVQEFTLPGTTEPLVRMRIGHFECHAEGVFVGLTISPLYPAPDMDGPRYIAAEHALVDTLTYRVRLPFATLADDPQLNVRWTVRRTDTGEAVLTSDWPAVLSLALDLDDLVVPLLLVNEFRIECRVYRRLGATAIEVFNSSLLLEVDDVLDRRHPYVKWSHEVYVPVVIVEPDGSRTQLGHVFKTRHSAIHRTDLPGRCRMVTRHSRDVHARGFGTWPPTVDYLDELPFPRADLAAHRAKVCDYCFFGGPTRTEPLIP